MNKSLSLVSQSATYPVNVLQEFLIAQKLYAEAAANTSAVWKMFDDAVELGDKAAKNDLAELASFCEFLQREAYEQFQEAKRTMLALAN